MVRFHWMAKIIWLLLTENSTPSCSNCKVLDSLIKCLPLVRGTREISILSIHGKNESFEWFFKRHDCGGHKGYFQLLKTRQVYSFFSYNNSSSLQRITFLPYNARGKLNCGRMLLVKNRSCKRLTQIVYSNGRATSQQIVINTIQINCKACYL